MSSLRPKTTTRAGTGLLAGPPPGRRDPAGYVIVLLSYLGMAGSAPLVAWADAPEAIILMLRMAFAALALGVVFLRRPMIADWRRPGAAWRLILMAAMSSLTLLLFFYAVRHTSVAIAMFMLFLMPVWVAAFAPRIFRSPREPIVWPALGLALAGLAVILVPDLVGEGVKLSFAGLAAALLHGLRLRHVHHLGEGPHEDRGRILHDLDGRGRLRHALRVAAGPLAVLRHRLSPGRPRLDGRCRDGRSSAPPIAYTLWIEGTRRVRVEHVTILGYIEPVAGPLYAVFLVGQTLDAVDGGRRRPHPGRRAARRPVRPRRGRGRPGRGGRARAAVMGER